MDAPQKAQVLLFIGDGEPVFDELDARAHQHLFKFGHGAEKLFVLVVRAKAHHPLHTRAVVPAAVKQHDLARRWQVRHIALKVPLRALAVVGRWQCGHTRHTRVQPLGDALDDAALASRIAPFKQNHHLLAAVLHPVLQLDEFALQAKQLLEVALALQLVGGHQVTRLIHIAVFNFQFQLFVVAVHQVIGDALHQVLSVER